MHDQAFEILGIEATTDGRAIRAAFVRLARIYHPDRFAGMPDDVRTEAERRMKDATVAYETLREARRSVQRKQPALSDAEIHERARKFREVVEAKRVEEQQNQARWLRWAEIERLARERAAAEAEIAAMIRGEVEGPPTNGNGVHHEAGPRPAPNGNGHGKNPSAFEQRLDAARRGQTAPLVRRSK